MCCCHRQDYIKINTKLHTKSGHLYLLRETRHHHEAQPDDFAFNAFNRDVGFDICAPAAWSLIYRKHWQMLQFQRADDAERVYDALKTTCDIVSVGRRGVHYTAVYRRTGHAALHLAGVGIVNFFTPKLVGKHAGDVMFRCLEAWGAMQEQLMSNFATYVPSVDLERVLQEWESYSEDEIQTEHIICMVQHRQKTATPRERFVAENFADLMKLRKLRGATADISIVSISDSTVLDIKIFVPKPSELQCWRRDVSDGSMQRFTVKQFIFDGRSVEHTKYALVLYGAPKLAKTPFAKAVALCLARMHQAKTQAEPYAIVVNTADSLPRGGDARMKSGVAVVFDDLRPGESRLNRPPHSVEDMKVLGDVASGGDMSARYSDIHFAPMMPRLFTSNASSPCEFYCAFPLGLDTMTNAEVLDMNPHALALVKRFAFCKVEQCLIPQRLRDAYEASPSAHVLEAGSGIFAGADEIP